MDPQTFDPKKVRYIKLGRGGAWTAEAFDRGVIPFGYDSADHGTCLEAVRSGNWDQVRASSSQVAARRQGQARAFARSRTSICWTSAPFGSPSRKAICGGPLPTDRLFRNMSCGLTAPRVIVQRAVVGGARA